MIFRRLKKSTKEQEEQFANMMVEEKIGWKDKLAMMISAFFVLVIPCLIILLLFAGLILLVLSLL